MRTCSVTGCGGTAIARGLCGAHWRRLVVRGDLLAHVPLFKIPRNSSRSRIAVRCPGCGLDHYIYRCYFASRRNLFCKKQCQFSIAGIVYKMLLKTDVKKSETECWEFQGGLTSDGYGKIWDGQREVGAHVMAYMAFVGAIAPGNVIRHSCDNPPCVNPSHLLSGTQLENVMDCLSKGRMAWQKSKAARNEIRRRPLEA